MDNNIALINHWLQKFKKDHIKVSKKYYKGENEAILNRKMQFVADGALMEDVYKANQKTVVNDYKTIVDQCTSYLLGKEPVISELNEDLMNDIPKKKLWEVSKKALKNSQVQSIAWAQAYIKKGKLEFMIHKNSENIIPIYKNSIDDELEKILYYYTVNKVINRKIKEILQVEVWTEEDVTYYNNIENKWVIVDSRLDNNDLNMNPMPHVVGSVSYENGTNKITKANSWGRVPFIPLKFNEEKQTVLQVIGKTNVDALDFLMSDGCNNFLDMAEAIYILENYNGDVSEALVNLKTKKAAAVGEGGGVKQLVNEIPMESRKTMIQLIKNVIYTNGQGIDLNGLRGGSLTNVVIKAWFAAIDLKVDNVIPSLNQFYTDLIEFVAIFNNDFKSVDIGEPTIAYNKSLIINVDDAIKSSNESVGNISNETRLANDPRVDDPKKEIERMNAEEVGTYEDDEVTETV